jgi:hypothetical protein
MELCELIKYDDVFHAHFVCEHSNFYLFTRHCDMMVTWMRVKWISDIKVRKDRSWYWSG